MRELKRIKIESGVKYLNESVNLEYLPANCLFDKGKVGSGGTTLAITSNRPYVIAVPFVSLIKNKMSQHNNIFGVFEGVTINDIKDYVANTENPVIMTTYDSIDKVTKAIGNPEDYYLLVDEYHLLFTQYAFRETAINKVLSSYTQYKEFCFMTATPLEEEFILEELKDIDIVIAEWEDIAEVSVKSILCPNGVTNSTIDLINAFLNGEEEGNLYLFVNSVKFIKEIIENINVTIDDCNVIYSENNKTEVGLERGILPSHKDGRIPAKKINLLTSTVFEGSDIYDENGRIFIVSDSSKANTLIDISTSFQQIAGRIRNSKYIKDINHLYTNTRYNHLTYDTFKEMCIKEIETTKEAVNELNSLSDTLKSMIMTKPNETYISEVNGQFSFNPNLVKLDIYNFKVCKHLYKIRINTLQQELEKFGYKTVLYTHNTEVRISSDDLEGFDTVVKNLEMFYTSAETGKFRLYTDEQQAYIDAALTRFPFLNNAIATLGYKGIEELGYVQTNIKRKLSTMLDTNQETKIYKLLKSYNDIAVGEFIPSKLLKNRLSNIYKELGLSNTAKASDIEKFYNCKRTKKNIKGKTVDGYILGNAKMLIK